MRILSWKEIAPDDEEFHVTSLNLSGGRKTCYDMHGHDFAELFLVERGELIHETNGRSSRLKSGDIGLIRPGDRHGFRTVDRSGFVYSNVAFPQSTFHELSERYFSDRGDFWGGNSLHPLTLSLPPSLSECLKGMIRQLGCLPRVRFEIDRFILNFYSEMRSVLFVPGADGKPSWLEYACREIRNPERLRIGLNAFNQLAGHCPEHVGRELKKHTGLTPSEFIGRLRLEHAARLLLQSDMKADDIAAECGFHNLGHFYSAFKARHNCTPRHYRLANRARII